MTALKKGLGPAVGAGSEKARARLTKIIALRQET